MSPLFHDDTATPLPVRTASAGDAIRHSVLSPRGLAILALGAGVAGLALLRRFSPTDYAFLPSCPVHAATGLFCPGCGTARALHALLHGDLPAAADLNLFTVALLPIFAAAALLLFVSAVRDNQIRAFALPRWAVVCLIGALLAFTVLRNLPFSWTSYLAP